MPNVSQFIAKMNKAGGFARQNRYKVMIHPNNIIQDLAAKNMPNYFKLMLPGASVHAAAERLTFFCDKAEIPGMGVATEDVRTYGNMFKNAYMPTYQDITLSFYVGADFNEKRFFDGWMYSIFDPVTQDMNYAGEYCTDVTIHVLDECAADSGNDPVSNMAATLGISTNPQNLADEMGLSYSEQKYMKDNTNPTEVSENSPYWVKLIDAFPTSINQLDLGYGNDNDIQRLSVTLSYKKVVPVGIQVDSTTNKMLSAEKREHFTDTLTLNSKGKRGSYNAQEKPTQPTSATRSEPPISSTSKTYTLTGARNATAAEQDYFGVPQQFRGR